MAIPILKKTTEFRIEKGVPVPSATNGNTKYPWAEMEVGDSFFVPTAKREIFKSNIYQKNRDGKKFIAKTEGNGVRVWRTA